MQKLYFPLPEAPGCYLNVAAALCLSALQRRPLEEGMGMEQSRGTENHRWGAMLWLHLTSLSATGMSRLKSPARGRDETTLHRRAKHICTSHGAWWRTLHPPATQSKRRIGRGCSHQLQPLIQTPPHRPVRNMGRRKNTLATWWGRLYLIYDSCNSSLSRPINRSTWVQTREFAYTDRDLWAWALPPG